MTPEPEALRFSLAKVGSILRYQDVLGFFCIMRLSREFQLCLLMKNNIIKEKKNHPHRKLQLYENSLFYLIKL